MKNETDIGNIKVFHQPRNRIAHNMAHRIASNQAFTPDCIKDAINEIDRLQEIEYEHQAMVAQESVLVKVDHCVEANEMVNELCGLAEHLRLHKQSPDDADFVIKAADLLARTEAKRVELETAGRALCDSERRGLVPYPSEWKAMEAALAASEGGE